MGPLFEIKEYIESGHSPFGNWFDSLDAVTAARVDKYIRRLGTGNFSSAKVLQEGVSELKWISGLAIGFISEGTGIKLSFYWVEAASGGNLPT